MADSTAENKTKALLANGDKNLVVTDNTKNDVSTTAHGFCPKAPNDASQTLLGTGVWGNLGWTTPAFNAADFTASGSMTWTVEAGDVMTYQYMIIGKTMWVNFRLYTTVVGGTPSANLLIKIPSGKVTQGTAEHGGVFLLDNAAYAPCRAISQGTYIYITRSDGANFTASPTGSTYVAGQIFFEIQ